MQKRIGFVQFKKCFAGKAKMNRLSQDHTAGWWEEMYFFRISCDGNRDMLDQLSRKKNVEGHPPQSTCLLFLLLLPLLEWEKEDGTEKKCGGESRGRILESGWNIIIR